MNVLDSAEAAAAVAEDTSEPPALVALAPADAAAEVSEEPA